MLEPQTKRTIAFVDGQNLFHAAREAFGHNEPNYDVAALARRICQAQGWSLSAVRFYTGVPAVEHNRRWHDFWERKLAAMRDCGISVYSRPLQYRKRQVPLPDGTRWPVAVGVEKGVDVRIAMDVTLMAIRQDYDVALLFSQDQDFLEVANHIRSISRSQHRWIKIACTFPQSDLSSNRRGINKTDWIPIGRDVYNLCLDSDNHHAPPPRITEAVGAPAHREVAPAMQYAE